MILKFNVEIRDYEAASGSGEAEIDINDVETAIAARMEAQGDEGSVIVTEAN